MKPKNPSKLFPLFLTAQLAKCKAFYTEQAGFRVVFDRENYLQVVFGEGLELCFMKPDAFPDGKVRPAFEGKGAIVSIPVADADEKFAEMKKAGAEILSEPRDQPWGWRSFLVSDPIGVVLDFFHVYKEIDPATM